jgi:NADH:ubiquinone oxidoreductase subunit 5 (subunit L)/multisubunit Na+/H+ antiporter MnhA subunit
MSGVIVKAGIYGIVRFGSMMTEGHYAIGLTLLVLGVVSGLYGISNAAANRDFKRVLAYCTIENVGIITMGIGLGFIGLSQGHQLIMYLGFGSCLLHTMNHALFKSLLFMSVGNVYTQMHTRDMETLGGIGKYMSKTQALFLTGSVAIAGMPPFGGFISELMLYGGLLMGFQSESLTLSVIMALSGIGLAIIGGISLMAFSKAFSVIFLGTPRTEYAHKPKEVSNAMLIPAYCILALMVATIIYVPVLVPKLSGIANELVYESGDASIEHMGELLDMMIGNIGTIGQVAIGFGALTGIIVTLLTIRHFVTARSAQETGPTWGCGYEAPLVKAQYTGVSFVGTFQEMCKAILPQTKHYKPLNEEEIFPHRRNYISVESDVVDDRVITPMTGALRGGLGKFEFIENGNLQRYIVYGLGYVLLLVAASFIG